jgi:hypothetical protein
VNRAIVLKPFFDSNFHLRRKIVVHLIDWRAQVTVENLESMTTCRLTTIKTRKMLCISL